jgi:putative transcriptional regulator
MDVTPAPSQFLIAAPWLRDPNFSRTVVLLCIHDEEEGTMGLVLNRPLGVTLGEGLPGTIAPARADVTIFAGGPVASTTLFALHDLDRLKENSTRMVKGVRFTPGTEELLSLLSEPPSRGEVLRLYAGCAGWSPGQLEEEIREQAWFLGPASAELVFSGDPQTLWQRALRSLGPEAAFLATMPEDLRLN